jgi:hypothetical protein
MPSWRFSRSSHSRPQTVDHPSEQPDNGSSLVPPRYSNLYALVESHAPAPEETSSNPVQNVEPLASRLSVVSLGSQLSSPSYTTYDNNDPDTFSICSSTITMTNPPQYSVSPRDRLITTAGTALGDSAATSDYTFSIGGSSLSGRCATLRLYDAAYPSYQGHQRARHPRYSNLSTMMGNVELHLSSSQTIRSIELKVRLLGQHPSPSDFIDVSPSSKGSS